jgi:EmrB/QacA subfamily drug resistance transporter
VTSLNTDTRLDPKLLRLAGILVVGALAPLLDSTIVNVAIPTLAHELHADVAAVQWVSTAYLLALAMAIPVTGWAADRVGAKRLWIAALTLFLAGSMLCGVAWDLGSLVLFRVLQGVGAGLMLPVMQTLLLRAAGGRQLGRLMAVVTLPALIGPILGPVVGGLIVGHLSWRWIFYVNVPVCLPAIVLAWRGIPPDSMSSPRRLDLAGLVLLSPALALLVYGLAQVGSHGGFGHTAVVVPLVGGALLLMTFVVRALRCDVPLIDLRLFGTRSFAAASALLFLSGLSMYGALLLLPLYYQQVLGYGAVAAGLLLAPQGLGSLLARAAGVLTDRIGSRPVVLGGVALTVLGTIPFALNWGSGPALAAALVVRGLGLSSVMLAVMVGAFRDLRPEQIPDASSTTRITQQLGGSFGAAVLAVLLQRQLAGHPAGTAYAHTFGWALVFTAVAILPALLIPRVAPVRRTG